MNKLLKFLYRIGRDFFGWVWEWIETMVLALLYIAVPLSVVSIGIGYLEDTTMGISHKIAGKNDGILSMDFFVGFMTIIVVGFAVAFICTSYRYIKKTWGSL
jgi:DNA-binding PucR family transcriptional regulator